MVAGIGFSGKLLFAAARFLGARRNRRVSAPRPRFVVVLAAAVAALIGAASVPSSVFAQEQPPHAVVYVMGGGDVPAKTKESLGAGITNVLASGKRYGVAHNGGAFFSEAAARQAKEPPGNSLTSEQISEIAAQLGIKIVCAANIASASNGYHIQIYAIESQTANVVSLGAAFSPLKSDADIAGVSEELVRQMSVGRIDAGLEHEPSADHGGKAASAPALRAETFAVYVAGGDVQAGTKNALGAGITNAVLNGRRYVAAPNAVGFLSEVVARQAKEVMTVEHISEIAAQFGVKFVCAADVIPAFEGAYHIQARTIESQTAEVVSLGGAFSALKSDADIISVSEELARQLSVGRVEPEPEPQTKASAPAPAAYSPPAPRAPAPPSEAQYTVAQYTAETRARSAAQTADDGADQESTARKSTNGFTLGYGFSGVKSGIFQAGFAQAHPIGQSVASFTWEANIWIGSSGYDAGYSYYSGGSYEYNFVGFNLPFLFQFDLNLLAVEIGVQLDALFNEKALLNAGTVLGTGVSLNKNRTHKIFYRLNYGVTYYSHMTGLRMLF